MLYKEFFLSDNKSGYKTNEKFLIKNHIDLYNMILNYCSEKELPKDLTIKEKIWYFINNVGTVVFCKECGKKIKFGRTLNEGYNEYCSIRCTNKNKEHKDKIISTNIERYGGNSPFNSIDIKNKIELTNIERYGVKNIFENVDFIEKSVMKKYGVSNVNKLDSVKEKRKQTNLDRYGYSTILSDKNFRNNLSEENLETLRIFYNLNFIYAKHNEYTIKCNICNSDYCIHPTTFKYRFKKEINTCLICNPVNQQSSFLEKQVVDFILSFGKQVIQNTTEIIKPKELDIYIPEDNLAIEFNGLYWHSELFKDGLYHLNKLNACNNLNLDLINIFEDEWIYKKDIIKSMISNKLNKTKNRVYARKCKIESIDNNIYKNFININHIQGYVPSKFKYGLFYNGDLVSVISFSGYRKNLGGSVKEGEFELLRFCNKLNYSVIGGFSKLFQYFLKKIKPIKIITYADRRYSNGNLYIKNNFRFISYSKPNYYYLDLNKNIRLNRFNYRKDILVKQGFDSTKTEKEIMFEREFYRIYDCGCIKFEFILQNT